MWQMSTTFFGDGDVLIERFLGAIEHQRGETGAQAEHVLLEIGAVIEVQHDRHIHQTGSNPDETGGEFQAGIADRALAHLQNDRGSLFLGSFDDALNLLHVVGVERAHGIVIRQGMFQNLLTGDERHLILLSFWRIH